MRVAETLVKARPRGLAWAPSIRSAASPRRAGRNRTPATSSHMRMAARSSVEKEARETPEDATASSTGVISPQLRAPSKRVRRVASRQVTVASVPSRPAPHFMGAPVKRSKR